MGSPYLKSNESILLSTNNVIINKIVAEAILTNERLMLIDTRSAELRPQDIPFTAIETVITDENPDSDPVLSLSLVTGPGVSQTLGIVFPQQPRMRRVAERDEWASRLRELIPATGAGGDRAPVEISPPWGPGPLPEEGGEGTPAAPAGTESKYCNPPLSPRRPRKTAGSRNYTMTAVGIITVIVIALAAFVLLYAPSLIGMAPVSPVIPTPVTTITPAVTPVPTTVLTPVPGTTITPKVTRPVKTPVTTVSAEFPEIIIPGTGVWVLVKYEGNFSGSAGAPGRFRTINGTGNHIFQLPVKDEIVTATIQKMDNTGRTLTVEIFETGTMVKNGSVSAPSGTVLLSADLRTA